MDLFLEFGADINAIDEEYRSTPMGWAAREGQEDMVDILLKRGADPNGGEEWTKPLVWTERRGYKDVANALKKAGASAQMLCCYVHELACSSCKRNQSPQCVGQTMLAHCGLSIGLHSQTCIDREIGDPAIRIFGVALPFSW